MAQLVLKVNPAVSPLPWGPLVIASLVVSTTSTPTAVVETKFDPDTPTIALTSGDQTLTTDPIEIVEKIAGAAQLPDDSSKSAAFLTLAKTLSGKLSFPEVTAALDTLDDHLTFRTFLVGHAITAADAAVWGSLRASLQVIGILKKAGHPHLQRWYTYFDTLPSTLSIISAHAEAKSTASKEKKAASVASSSFALGLQNAVDGQVVTRFPPEPSGYLHIGHAKAALLNQYFAQMYHGKLLIRFDDTNPSKEKAEFEDSIVEDLALMGIKGDKLSHTSDYFQELYDWCIQVLKEGKAYADDTVQEKMRQERMDGIASARRDTSPAENIARFEEMARGTEEGQRWCIRAKLSVDDPNKALRDPVIYRVNMLPHHRTGDKWKVYPTYDFACPLVDSLEGVTHALRTNEYRDRNPQYQWMIEALGVRKVEIWDYSRVNFVYTLLSKRKLHWFVNNGFVSGWDDPRFPTVRGIRRRGMTVEGLKNFMLQQGPSQSQMLLEWDGIWAANKKVIDPIVPRFWAVTKEKSVEIKLKGAEVPQQIEVKDIPKHKKNPEVGLKKTTFSNTIIVDQEDAASFEDNEEITLMDWGNAIIRTKSTDASTGAITSIETDLFLEGDFKKTKKKIHWLPSPSSSQPLPTPLVDVVLIDYDYLITKKKLEEEDDVSDFVTATTEFRTEAWADSNVVSLAKGDIIQFERKGYYILDAIVKKDSGDVLEFILIPDGKASGVATKSSAAPADPNAKTMLSDGATGFEIPVSTKMYKVDPVVGGAGAEADTKMYKVDSIYQPGP
ncbi:glutamate-tRNA ligase [Clavulina sp. PMI_390]|nr:glutamate-tRNA ligase [Clavulina sp. PMI_390]